MSGQNINTFDLPYLLAKKIEAFKGRGKGDFRSSHDIEDIITLIDGRSSVGDDLKMAKGDILNYLKVEFKNFLSIDSFLQSIEGHVSDRENTLARKNIVIERIQSILK